MLFIIAERRGKKVFLIVRVHDKLLIWLFVLIVLRVYHLSDHIWDPIRGRYCSRFDQWKGERGSQDLPYVWKGGADVWAIVLTTLAMMDDRTVTRCRCEMRGAAEPLSRSASVSPDHFNTGTRHWSLRPGSIVWNTLHPPHSLWVWPRRVSHFRVRGNVRVQTNIINGISLSWLSVYRIIVTIEIDILGKVQ